MPEIEYMAGIGQYSTYLFLLVFFLEVYCHFPCLYCAYTAFCFSLYRNVTFMRKIKPYKSLLGLDSLKQKAIERFLGIFRTDPYSGGQLIEVYQDYLTTRTLGFTIC